MKARSISVPSFLGLLFCLLVSCASNPETETSILAEETGSPAPVVAPSRPLSGLSHSGLTDEDVGKVILVRGLIAVGEDGYWFLTENPDSRSSVVFLLSDPRGLLIAGSIQEGSIISIEGILTDASATWRKKMEIQTIK